jgi:hypothetical protein
MSIAMRTGNYLVTPLSDHHWRVDLAQRSARGQLGLVAFIRFELGRYEVIEARKNAGRHRYESFDQAVRSLDHPS